MTRRETAELDRYLTQADDEGRDSDDGELVWGVLSQKWTIEVQTDAKGSRARFEGDPDYRWWYGQSASDAVEGLMKQIVNWAQDTANNSGFGVENRYLTQADDEKRGTTMGKAEYVLYRVRPNGERKECIRVKRRSTAEKHLALWVEWEKNGLCEGPDPRQATYEIVEE